MTVEQVIERISNWAGPERYKGPRPQLVLVTTEPGPDGTVPVLALYLLGAGASRPVPHILHVGTIHPSDAAPLRARIAWLITQSHTINN